MIYLLTSEADGSDSDQKDEKSEQNLFHNRA